MLKECVEHDILEKHVVIEASILSLCGVSMQMYKDLVRLVLEMLVARYQSGVVKKSLLVGLYSCVKVRGLVYLEDMMDDGMYLLAIIDACRFGSSVAIQGSAVGDFHVFIDR